MEPFDTDRFITEINSRPTTWNSLLPEYSNKVLKRNAWDELCQIFYSNLNEKTNKEKNLAVQTKRPYEVLVRLTVSPTTSLESTSLTTSSPNPTKTSPNPTKTSPTTTTTSPTTKTSPTATTTSPTTESSSSGTKIVIIVGSIAALGILIGAVFVWKSYRVARRARAQPDVVYTGRESHIYEEVQYGIDISQRPPHPLPTEEAIDENRPYIHYDTPYEWRLPRLPRRNRAQINRP